MVGVGNGNLSTVLEKVDLGHLLDNFQREKITFGSHHYFPFQRLQSDRKTDATSVSCSLQR